MSLNYYMSSEDSDVFEDTIASRGSSSLKRGNTQSSDSTQGNGPNDEKRHVGGFEFPDFMIKTRKDLEFERKKQTKRVKFTNQTSSDTNEDQGESHARAHRVSFLEDKSLSESDFDSSSDENDSANSEGVEIEENYTSDVINISIKRNSDVDSTYSEHTSNGSTECITRNIENGLSNEVSKTPSPLRDPVKIFDELIKLKSEEEVEEDVSEPESFEELHKGKTFVHFDDELLNQDSHGMKAESDFIALKKSYEKNDLQPVENDIKRHSEEEVNAELTDGELKSLEGPISDQIGQLDSNHNLNECQKYDQTPSTLFGEIDPKKCDNLTIAEGNLPFTDLTIGKESPTRTYEISCTSDNAQIDLSDISILACNTTENLSKLLTDSSSEELKIQNGANDDFGINEPLATILSHTQETQFDKIETIEYLVSISDKSNNEVHLNSISDEQSQFNQGESSKNFDSLDCPPNAQNNTEALLSGMLNISLKEKLEIDNNTYTHISQPEKHYSQTFLTDSNQNDPETINILDNSLSERDFQSLDNIKENFFSCISLEKCDDENAELSSENDFEVFKSSLSLANNKISYMLSSVKKPLSSEMIESLKNSERITNGGDVPLHDEFQTNLNNEQTICSPGGDAVIGVENYDSVQDQLYENGFDGNGEKAVESNEATLLNESDVEEKDVLRDHLILELSADENAIDFIEREDQTKIMTSSSEEISKESLIFGAPFDNVCSSSSSGIFASSYIDTEALKELHNKLSSEESETKVSIKEGSEYSGLQDGAYDVTISDIDLRIGRISSTESLEDNADFDTDLLKRLQKSSSSDDIWGSTVGSEHLDQEEPANTQDSRSQEEPDENPETDIQPQQEETSQVTEDESRKRKELSERLEGLQEMLESLHRQLTEEREWNKVFAAELAMETRRIEEARHFDMLLEPQPFGCRQSSMGWGQVDLVREQIRAKRLVAAMDFKARLVQVEAECSAELDNLENAMEKLEPLNRMASVWAPIPDYSCGQLSSSWMRRDFFMEVTRSMNVSSNEGEHERTLKGNKSENKIA